VLGLKLRANCPRLKSPMRTIKAVMLGIAQRHERLAKWVEQRAGEPR